MIYNIRSSEREVSVKSVGAELCSIKALKTGDEFMWSGDASIWSGIAPILFPVVGALKNNQLQWKGREYSMEKHGFARRQDFSLVDQTGSEITLRILSSPELLQSYPFSFELLVRFVLVDNQLTITYTITNTGAELMCFNIGSHPAFRLPLDDADIEDYLIEFSEEETLDLFGVKDDLLTTSGEPYLESDRHIPLTQSLFDHDALVFKNISARTISLNHKTRGRRVSVETGGAPHLGIWAKPAAPYVCIEPWWGHADSVEEAEDFREKTSVQTLEPASSFTTAINISTFDTTTS